MDSFACGSKGLLQNDTQPYPHTNNRQRHLEALDRPTKRRRSISPLNDKLSRCKRATLIHHHLQTTLTKTKKEEHSLSPSCKSTPTISAAVDSMNERATRLGLENAYPEDVEMDFCPNSEGEEADDEETSYERERVPIHHHSTPTITSSSSSSSILPLHKPHPLAYQQHLALISSTRSKKLSNSNRILNSQKLLADHQEEHESRKENNQF